VGRPELSNKLVSDFLDVSSFLQDNADLLNSVHSANKETVYIAPTEILFQEISSTEQFLEEL